MPNVYVLPDQRLIPCRVGEALLPAALRAGIAFTHACGGHGSCSTCRVVVLKGWESCAPRTAKERAIADRLCFGDEFRLACQTKVTGDVTVRRLVLDRRDEELADIRLRGRDTHRWKRPLNLLRRGGSGRVAEPIGDEAPVAAMFADIRGFTAFAEAVLPYDVIHVLQRRLRDVTDAIERHGGVVTSYMGDGVMALFRHDRPQPSHRAVRAGLDILDEADAGRPGLEELYGRSFDLNIGVHYGTAIVGSLWGDPGTVTAIGDTVNLAHRIEQANKERGTRFLVSEPTIAELGGDVRVGRSFTCTLPGKAGEHRLVEVVGLSSSR